MNTTEFKCGIYKAQESGIEWVITVNQYTLAIVTIDGINISFTDLRIQLTADDLAEITVLMNNIKRQYKQLQNT